MADVKSQPADLSATTAPLTTDSPGETKAAASTNAAPQSPPVPQTDQQIAEARMPMAIADAPDAGGDYQPQGESEQMLLGPTARPQEPITAGIHGAKIDPPESARKWLPVVADAAKDPNAPPQIILLARLMAYHMGL